MKYLIVICLLVQTYSCSKKGGTVTPDPVIPDTTKPTISITNPVPAQSFTPGTAITFQASFSDNVKLKSYEISISKVTSGAITLKNVPVSVPFSYTKSSTSFNTGVKQQDIILSDINIPANDATTIVTPGNYNFKVTCYDGSDNKTETIIIISIN